MVSPWHKTSPFNFLTTACSFFFSCSLQKKVDANNVVDIIEETKQLSSLNDTLKPEDIDNVAKVLENVVELRQRQNKVGCALMNSN